MRDQELIVPRKYRIGIDNMFAYYKTHDINWLHPDDASGVTVTQNSKFLMHVVDPHHFALFHEIHKTQIFYGARGVGKTSLARIHARGLLCDILK